MSLHFIEFFLFSIGILGLIEHQFRSIGFGKAMIVSLVMGAIFTLVFNIFLSIVAMVLAISLVFVVIGGLVWALRSLTKAS